MKTVRVPCLILTLVLGIASAHAGEPRSIDVVLGSYFIKPDKISVKVGQPVTLNLVNEASMVPHDLVIKAPDAGIDIAMDVAAGKKASVTFTPTRVGSYEMFCDKKLLFFKSHKDKGMHGILEVVE
jgi:plastocyanin